MHPKGVIFIKGPNKAPRDDHHAEDKNPDCQRPVVPIPYLHGTLGQEGGKLE